MTRIRVAVRPRTVLLALVAVMAFSLAVQRIRPADAFWGWCFDDPQVLVNGRPMAIITGVLGDPALVGSPVAAANITIRIPRNTTGKVTLITHDYYSENVSFIADQPLLEKGKNLVAKVDVTYTMAATAARTSSSTGTPPAPSPLPAVLQISGDSGLPFQHPGHTNDQLHQDYNFAPTKP